MSMRSRINGFTAWVNIRLSSTGDNLNSVVKELLKGTHMKYLIESITGHDFKRLQSYDGLTHQQKVTRAEWILNELKNCNIVPDDAKLDFKMFAANSAEQIFDLLWYLVSHDIWFTWERMEYLQQSDPSVLCQFPFRWIPEPLPEGFDPKKQSISELQNYEPYPGSIDMKSYKKKHFDGKSKLPKPHVCILEMIRNHLKMSSEGRRLHVMTLDDVADVRVLCALINSFIPNAFTAEVFLNDRWAMNLLLRCMEDVLYTPSGIDSEDLAEGDTRALSAYFCFVFMAGYKYKQCCAVAQHYEELQSQIRDIQTDIDKLHLNVAASEYNAKKTEMEGLLKACQDRVAELKSKYDLKYCQEWMVNTTSVLNRIQRQIKEKMTERYEAVSVPRSITMSDLCLSLVINLSLTGGIGYYHAKSRETLTEGRSVILRNRKTKEYIDEVNKVKGTIRKLLKLPLNDIVDVNPEKYTDFDIFVESPSKNKKLSPGQEFLYQVFPGSTSVWEKTLQRAAKEGDLNTVQKLVSFFRVQPNFISCREKKTGNTPLHMAARFGHLKTVLFLLENGADYDAKNNFKYTPLFSAVEGSHKEVCHLLIEWGCDVHVKSIRGSTAIESCRNDELQRHMIEQYEFYSAVVPQIMDGDLARLQAVIDDHKSGARRLVSLHSRCINGSTLLHTAAYFGSLPLLRDLLQLRVDVNTRDYKGATPLHRARDADTLRFLLEAGALLNAEDADGNLPLHVKSYGEAGRASDLDAVALLLDSGAKMAAPNARALLPIHCAAMQGRVDVIELLLRRDAAGDGRMALALHDEGPDHPPSLVHLALANDAAAAAAWLLDQGFAFKPREPDQLLQRVVTAQLQLSDRAGVVRFLLTHGAAQVNIHYPGGGHCPLHFAAALPDASDLLLLLLEAGADVDAANDDLCSPLFAACQANNFAAAALLLEHGANPRAKNRQGLTALDYVPDYEEWIDCGLFSDEMCARVKAYGLKHTRDLVRAISKKVRPTAAMPKSALETLHDRFSPALLSKPNTNSYLYPPSTAGSHRSVRSTPAGPAPTARTQVVLR